jgi:hypothetical protein
MIEFGEFRSRSGMMLPWKLDADDLSDRDIEGIALIIRRHARYCRVIGVPRGGLRLAAALLPWETSDDATLIVDDVLTTGASMEEARAKIEGPSVGVVIFARGPCPDWVHPIFTVSGWAQQ